jgi:hypothetical protein
METKLKSRLLKAATKGRKTYDGLKEASMSGNGMHASIHIISTLA